MHSLHLDLSTLILTYIGRTVVILIPIPLSAVCCTVALAGALVNFLSLSSPACRTLASSTSSDLDCNFVSIVLGFAEHFASIQVADRFVTYAQRMECQHSLSLISTLLLLFSLPSASRGASCSDLFACSAHGICTAGALAGTIVCSCVTGYYGDTCQYSTLADGCSSQPCSGNGQCIPAGGTNYVCLCYDTYYGDFCQYGGSTTCAASYCNYNGHCSYDILNQKTCSCYSSYTGPLCASDIVSDSCSLSYCSYHGECSTTASGTRSCQCYSGYSGTQCQDDNDIYANGPQIITSGVTTTISGGGIAGIIVGVLFVLFGFIVIPCTIMRIAGKQKYRQNRRQHTLSPTGQAGSPASAPATGQCQMIAVARCRPADGSAGGPASTMVFTAHAAPGITHTVTPLDAPAVPNRHQEGNPGACTAHTMAQQMHSSSTCMPAPAQEYASNASAGEPVPTYTFSADPDSTLPAPPPYSDTSPLCPDV
ncbi:delta-like protein 3 [Sycon ciliatum]|uniref:delta-like protein 3 n=1 Tax=Sycon ciliatum TaxID=27933 RepID=UPI0031F61026